jgi:hypothetical protein
MTDQHTDGNEAAGALQQLLAVDVTVLMRTCHSCGARNAVGAHRAYHGAGIVLRCPACEDVAVRVAEDDAGVTVEWRGVFRVER